MPVPFNPWEIHHLYIGVVAVLLGVAMLDITYDHYLRKWHSVFWTYFFTFVVLAGVLAIVDDINQHWGNGVSMMHDIFVLVWNKIFGGWWPFGAL